MPEENTNDQSVGQLVQENIPQVERQEEPMPSSEEISSTENLSQDELPEGVSERTKTQFEKLKEEKQRMREELEAYKSRERESQYGQSVYDFGKPKTPSLSQTDVNTITADFVDPEGNVDIQGLNRALAEANARARRAEEMAMQSREEQIKRAQTEQIKQAHEKFPWLDPKSSNFDPAGFELVRDRLVRHLAEGREPSLTEVAESVSKVYKPQIVTEDVKKKAVEDYKQEQETKAQASSVGNQGQKRVEVDLDELKTKSRNGDLNAIRERIKRFS